MDIQGQKISQMSELSEVSGQEYIPVVDSGGNNKKVKTDKFAKKSDIPDISGLATKTEVEEAITQATADQLTKTEAAETYATKQSLEGLSGDVEQLKLSQSPYAVAGWDPDELAPESVSFFRGTKDILMKYDFYLLDTTDNTRQATKPVGKLMRNNLLRFADGSFAPTVGITESQRAECDVELYLDEAQQQKYCDAGAFEAEAFYNEHGMAKLYNSEGTEVRVLRPWETTETKYTIGIARTDTVYLLDNVIGESGKAWKGIFANPVVWDGIDVSKYPLVPTAIGPGPACTVNKKTRNFLYLYKGEGNCQSGKGQNNLCTMFYDQEKTYPRVNDMQQINNMTYARSNNADANAPYPFAEGGYHALNTLVTELEVLYGTKYLHNANMFGSGISSNDSCANEGNWLVNGGVRFKKNGTETWTYAKWSEQKDIYYNATGSRTHFSTLLNSEHPKEACMESQMAFSFAMETGVPEDTEFEFYGYKYRYVSVPGTDGTASMNVRVYKVMSQTFTAYTSDGTEQSWDVEVNLRMSLYSGVNLAGDVFMYCGGGYEQVGTCLYPTSASTGNPVKFYLQLDQLQWHTEKTSSKTELGVFDFESQYPMIGEGTNLGDGYALRWLPYAPWKIEKGGSISTGECMYVWDNNNWSTTLNQRVRLACRSRGSAYYSFCSPRTFYASYAVTFASRFYGGSAQALIE